MRPGMGRPAQGGESGPPPSPSGRAGRLAALLAAGLLAGVLAGCEASAGPRGDGHAEAWHVDVPARFTFPPVGLEEFALARTRPGSLELVIHIGADGTLERLAAEKVEGFDEAAVEELFEAVRHARFAPALLGGRPVASIKRIAFDVDPLASRYVTTARMPDGAR